MAIAPVEELGDTDISLESVHAALIQVAGSLAGRSRMLSPSETVRTLTDVEDISHIVDYLQVLVAGMAEERDLASGETPHAATSLQTPGSEPVGGGGGGAGDDASGNRFRNCVDYLRARLGISRAEARRRLDLAHRVLPGISPSGAPVEPQAGAVGAAFASGALSGRAATVICSAVERVRCLAVPEQLVSMEHQLTRQALEADEDVLRILARRWETVLDQDGQEPTDKVLRSRQGVFLRGRRNGLQVLEIGATDEQYEHLVTAMTTATNPRTPTDRKTDEAPGLGAAEASADGRAGGSLPSTAPDSPTRAQSLLDGLVGACRIALSTSHLPATGGHRPQVMVTIDYRDLLRDLHDIGDRPAGGGGIGDRPAGSGGSGGNGDRLVGGRGAVGEAGIASPTGGNGTGRAVFAEQLSARTIRRIACDADLIPLVLGGEGQILDVGRAGRLFPPPAPGAGGP